MLNGLIVSTMLYPSYTNFGLLGNAVSILCAYALTFRLEIVGSDGPFETPGHAPSWKIGHDLILHKIDFSGYL